MPEPEPCVICGGTEGQRHIHGGQWDKFWHSAMEDCIRELRARLDRIRYHAVKETARV